MVVVSSDTDKFLRSTHKKDISTFNVTVKKIKYVSDHTVHIKYSYQNTLQGTLVWPLH